MTSLIKIKYHYYISHYLSLANRSCGMITLQNVISEITTHLHFHFCRVFNFFFFVVFQIGSIISQEGLSNSDVIAEITLNETEDGQTVAVVSETNAHNHIDDIPQTHVGVLSFLMEV